MHLQVCRGEERGETHTRARSPHIASLGQAGRGEVRRWARAHDVHVNNPPKSGPKPRRSAASFYRLILLRIRVYYVLIEIDIISYRTL
jgi:hypothetical protein